VTLPLAWRASGRYAWHRPDCAPGCLTLQLSQEVDEVLPILGTELQEVTHYPVRLAAVAGVPSTSCHTKGALHVPATVAYCKPAACLVVVVARARRRSLQRASAICAHCRALNPVSAWDGRRCDSLQRGANRCMRGEHGHGRHPVLRLRECQGWRRLR